MTWTYTRDNFQVKNGGNINLADIPFDLLWGEKYNKGQYIRYGNTDRPISPVIGRKTVYMYQFLTSLCVGISSIPIIMFV